MSDTIARPAKKVRPPPRQVFVHRVDQVTPKLIRIAFSGPELADFAAPKPGGHIKLFFVSPQAIWPPADASAPRPPSRTYTPRRFDPKSGVLEVEFVLHGDGLASNWAQAAKVGDRALVGGPGGGYPIAESIEKIVIVADDTAGPAAGMIIEALPKGCRATIICEVENAQEERPLSPAIACAPIWLHRASASSPATLLEGAVEALAPQPPGTHWWVACEAGAMRRIRDFLLRQRGIPPAQLHTRGYWKAGDTNHPDHDYGND